eukprot:scaffold7648_cov106-Skeletonema_menzelii.AAC.1
MPMLRRVGTYGCDCSSMLVAVARNLSQPLMLIASSIFCFALCLLRLMAGTATLGRRRLSVVEG